MKSEKSIQWPLQSKLLTVLQKRKSPESVKQINSSRTFRLICPLIAMLHEMVMENTFRQDLLIESIQEEIFPFHRFEIRHE